MNLTMSFADSVGTPCWSVTVRFTMPPAIDSTSDSFRFFTGTPRFNIDRPTGTVFWVGAHFNHNIDLRTGRTRSYDDPEHDWIADDAEDDARG